VKRKLLPLCLGAMLIAATTPFTLAAEKKAPEVAGVAEAEVVVLTAKVQAVDPEKRTLTLQGPQGNTVTLKVDKNVKNFDQIKVGDQIETEFYDSVAVYLKPGGKPSAGGEFLVREAPPGHLPKGVVVDTMEVAAKVEAIDKAKRTVTLKGPEGNTVTVKVHKNVKEFDQLKVGDDIVARYTEAVAIAIKAPAGKGGKT
jgi:hypothetical protein